MKVKFKVQKGDYQGGEWSCRSCPVARCIRRTLREKGMRPSVVVGAGEALIGGVSHILPPNAEKVRQFYDFIDPSKRLFIGFEMDIRRKRKA